MAPVGSKYERVVDQIPVLSAMRAFSFSENGGMEVRMGGREPELVLEIETNGAESLIDVVSWYSISMHVSGMQRRDGDITAGIVGNRAEKNMPRPSSRSLSGVVRSCTKS